MKLACLVEKTKGGQKTWVKVSKQKLFPKMEGEIMMRINCSY